MAELFRKSALDKLSSPDQVDRAVVLVPKSSWLAVLGCAIIIISGIIWSVNGRISQTVNISGMYVTEDGIHSVMAPSTGIVEEVFYKNGDTIEKGDVLASIDSQDVERKLYLCQERIENVKSVTMESTGDIVTSDNKALIDIKNQSYTLNQTLYQNESMLAVKSQDLANQIRIENEAQNNMMELERQYYETYKNSDNTAEQLAYNQAQDRLSTVSSYLENYSESLARSRINYNQSQSAYDDIKDEYEAFEKRKENALNALNEYEKQYNNQVEKLKIDLKRALKDYETKAEELKQELLKNNETPESDPDYMQLQNRIGEIKDVIDEAGRVSDETGWISFDAKGYADTGSLLSIAERYSAEKDKHQSALASLEEKESQYKATIDQYKRELTAAEDTYRGYRDKVNDYTSQKHNAAKEWEGARDRYLEKSDVLIADRNNQSIQSNEYSIATSRYNTEKANLKALEDTVKQLEIQVDSDRNNIDMQLKNLHAQFEATQNSIISQLNMEMNDYKKQLDDTSIRSTVSGTISNISLVSGSMIAQGNVIARVIQGDDPDNIIVCYAPVSSGKKIKNGMRIMIYPSTVNKQEYGHLEGMVEEVSDYVISSSDIQNMLGNDELVQAFSQNGPVVSVRCRIIEDNSTLSGYKWSSSKGRDVAISSGTMMSVDVVTEEKQPISLLLPYIKEKLNIVPANEEKK